MSYRSIALIGLMVFIGGIGYVYLSPVAVINIVPSAPVSPKSLLAVSVGVPPSLEASSTTGTPLKDPPVITRAKYFTAWSAGLPRRMDAFLKNASQTKINAVVIDIKDYSGYVSYAMEDPEVKEAGSDQQLRIGNINALLTKLHAQNIYVIGRVTVFQDPIFAKAHPELALSNKRTGAVWKDGSGLAWLDPAGKPTWDYVAGIARDAFLRGFDEINFDYVRFPSDGALEEAKYPFWDGVQPKHEVLKDFFAYLRRSFPDNKISADLFGLTTINNDDLGIGQVIEDAYPYFDYVSPMIYPSHYSHGTLGFANPALYPYEIISYSLRHALAKREATSVNTLRPLAKIRPWLQVFDLGAIYIPERVQAELKATDDVFHATDATEAFGGWLLWDPNNSYLSYDKLFNS
jgi:hypothetical protein